MMPGPCEGAHALVLACACIAAILSASHAANPAGTVSSEGLGYVFPKAMPAYAQPHPYAPIPELYTSMTRIPGGKVYHNVWWHNHRFFGVVSADKTSDDSLFDDGMSVGQVLNRVPILDLPSYAAASRIAFVPGTSVLADFPFQSLPDHLGHWAEIMVPMYNVLKEGAWRQALRGGKGSKDAVVDKLILPNMNRDFKSWFRVVLQAAVKPAVKGGTGLPTFVDYAELYAYDNLAWLVFENIVVPDDRYTHPQAKRGFVHTDHGDLWRNDNCARWISSTHRVAFSKPEYGQEFRESIYRMSALPAPAPWQPGTPPPHEGRHMTLVIESGDDFPGIANYGEFKQALEELAAEHGMKLHTVSLSEAASFGSHMTAVSNTSVLVGKHSSIMANSMLMPPGSMVFELLPYKWEWANLSTLYYNITQSVGDIHHFAWRPTHYKWAKFRNASDLRYHTWTPEECSAYECVNKLRLADVIADIPTVTDVLRKKLPAVLRGEPVDKLREPWPRAV